MDRPRRPAPTRVRGVRAWVLGCAAFVLLAGCAVDVHAPDASEATTRACRSFVEALPEKVGDQRARDVSDPDRGAAWGDPAIVLTCGVGPPKDYDPATPCQETDGIGWYVPVDQMSDHPVDVTLTTIGRSPRLRVFVPRDYTPSTVTADLVATVKQHTRRTGGCL